MTHPAQFHPGQLVSLSGATRQVAFQTGAQVVLSTGEVVRAADLEPTGCEEGSERHGQAEYDHSPACSAGLGPRLAFSRPRGSEMACVPLAA